MHDNKHLPVWIAIGLGGTAFWIGVGLVIATVIHSV